MNTLSNRRLNSREYLMLSICILLYLLVFLLYEGRGYTLGIQLMRMESTQVQEERARNQSVNEKNIPYANICNSMISQIETLISVYMVIRFSKRGLISTFVINGLASLYVIIQICLEKKMTTLPGFILPLVNIFVCIFFYSYLQKIIEMGIRDGNTGLYNTNRYIKYLQTFNARLISNIGCVYVDVNALHKYNNTYGHHAGDQVLQKVATALKRYFSQYDIYRIGGDEFIVICENCNKLHIEMLIDELKDSLKDEEIDISVGVEWRNSDMFIEDVVKCADQKMYDDKKIFYENILTMKEASGNKKHSGRHG